MTNTSPEDPVRIESESPIDALDVPILAQLGTAVGRIRKLKQITQAQLALCAEVPVEKIDLFEIGNWDIDLKSLYKLAACLNTTVSDIASQAEIFSEHSA